jgi:hypothetical protein
MGSRMSGLWFPSELVSALTSIHSIPDVAAFILTISSLFIAGTAGWSKWGLGSKLVAILSAYLLLFVARGISGISPLGGFIKDAIDCGVIYAYVAGVVWGIVEDSIVNKISDNAVKASGVIASIIYIITVAVMVAGVITLRGWYAVYIAFMVFGILAIMWIIYKWDEITDIFA